ncbi:hypothetical protein HNP99_000258 [Flavobacterium sp. 28A]|uniref:PIN domain-containing protein n=1 Tax=Flavobacterium sp. 28A TaxID=2735895 RepID=UPI00156E5355|nr:PIN domain-containing protein [Flavobacterium sp. 28A]NRT13933.1 hypothetical protein [Flavobacterium sp. 28A]
MIIFIDTNIIYGHWHLQNANFQYLLNYLENTNSTLAVSEIVCDEIDNKFHDELNAIESTLKNNIKKYNTLINKNSPLIPDKLDNDYSFKSLLMKRTNHVNFFPFNLVPNQKLVERAIKKIKPFKEDDKGFRDTLIWLSFLDYLKLNKNEDIAFINNNSSDFYNLAKINFHNDLIDDIKSYGLTNNFKVYESIKDFINAEVRDQHKYTSEIIMTNFIYPQESIIEQSIEQYINSQSQKWLTDILKEHSRSFENLSYLIKFSFRILEGIEDPKLLHWEEIEENTFFGELRFFLKNTEIQLTLPKTFYEENQLSFPKRHQIETNSDYITMTIFSKSFLNISFNFDTNIKTVKNLEINIFGLL